jgi:hypothetical protein
MSEEIINKVAKANIIQIDLGDYHTKETIYEFDIKQALWQELVIKEDLFREFIKTFDWTSLSSKYVALYCSVDAIIPAWAFMLITTELKKVNAFIYFGDEKEVKSQLFFTNLQSIDVHELEDQRVMVKGCSTIPNPNRAYVELTDLLVPKVKMLMFGEPCSAVPVFKRK